MLDKLEKTIYRFIDKYGNINAKGRKEKNPLTEISNGKVKLE